MALSTTTSPPTQAHLDSSKRKRAAEDKSNSKDGSKSRPDCSTSSNTYSLEPQTHQAATKLPTVYGPELPPSMARSKAPSTVIDSEILPSMENFADIAQLLASECHDDSSRVECMKRAESVLQCLFRSRLMAIMNHYGYKDNEFTKKDLARVMVNIGLISSVTDDPVLAMASRVASKVKAEMPNIVRTKMQLSADSASNPDLLTDIAVDSISIDALVDISREGSILSNDSAAIAAAIACADAYFEDAMKTVSNISVTECFSLAELYQDQLYADPESVDSPLSARQWTTRAVTPPPPQPPTPVLQQQTATQKAQPSTSTSTSMPTITAAATATDTSAPASAKQYAATTSKDLVIDSTSATASDAGQLLKKGKRKRSKRKSKGKRPDSSTGVVEAPTLAVMALDLTPAQPHTHVHKTAAVKIVPPSRAVCTSASPAPTPAPAHSSATSLGKQADASSTLWNSDSVEEQKQVRSFWLEISDVQRQALILVEKEVVMARVRDHQNFSCSCNVCTRKREAIEHELDCLYDCYFEELQESVRRERMRMMVHEAEKKARSTIMSSVHAIAESMVIKMITERDPSKRKEDVQKSIHESIKQSRLNGSLFDSSLKETEAIIEGTMRKVAAAAAVSGIAKPIREGTPNVPNEVVNVGEAALAIKEWADGAFNFRREFGDESLQSDVESDEAFNNNDLFYTEHMLDTIDTFPTDSKKFFDMMERLAEYRMRREDALQDLVDGHGSSASAIEATYDAHTRSGMSSHTWVRRARESARQQRRCPDCHGEISECEEQPPCFPATTKASTMSTFVRKHPESGAIIHSLDGLGAEDFLNSLDNSDYEDIDDDDEEDDDDDNDDEDDEGDLEVDIEDELYDSDHDDKDEDEDEDDELDETDDDFDDLDSEGAEREAEEGRKVFQLFAARLFEQRVINAYREKVALDRQQNLIKELEEEEKRNAMKDKRKQIKKEQEKERKRKSQLKKEEERMAKESKVKAEQQRKREADEKKHQEMMAKKREQDIKMKKAQEERNRKILEEADRRMEKEKAERKRSEEEMYEREKERKQAIEQKRQEELQKREKKQSAPAATTLSANPLVAANPAVSVPVPVPVATDSKPPAATHPAVPVSMLVPMLVSVSLSAAAGPILPKAEVKPVSGAALFTAAATAAAASAAAEIVPTSTPKAETNTATTTAVASANANVFLVGSVSGTVSPPPSSQPMHLHFPQHVPSPVIPEASVRLGGLHIDSLPSDNLERHLTSAASPASPLFRAPRPSVPLIYPFDMGNTSPSLSFGAPTRARANSGSNLLHCMLPGSAPMQAPAASHAVSPEIDAEIMSILGRVMGSSTLQDDLIDGAEWRTEPSSGYSQSGGRSQLPSAPLMAPFGIGNSLVAPLSDMTIRRNSVPLNRLVGDSSKPASPDVPGSSRFQAPLGFESGDIESVHSAYCALERFRRDMRASPAATGSDLFGGYQSAAELAKMHGKLKEADVWGVCVKHAQSNPSTCRLNHTTRAVSFARTGSVANALGMSPTKPAAPESVMHLGGGIGSSTPLGHLSVISEDMLSAFSLQPPQAGNINSPLPTNGIPRNMPLLNPQPHSPLTQSSQQQQQQLGSTRIPMMTPLGMSMTMQQQPPPPMTMPHAGTNYSPLSHASTNASLYFNQMHLHHPGSSLPPMLGAAAPQFALPSYQQPTPISAESQGFGLSFGQQPILPSSWSPAKSSLGGNFGDLAQHGAPLRPLQPQFHPMHVFSSPQHQQPQSQLQSQSQSQLQQQFQFQQLQQQQQQQQQHYHR